MHQLHLKQCPNTLLYQQIMKKKIPFFKEEHMVFLASLKDIRNLKEINCMHLVFVWGWKERCDYFYLTLIPSPV